ncbi:CopG family ribbon-helix-helix protein [Pseudomonas sp. JUb42]|jgi:predicted transcriptional regulator|uniref:CopG family ribbon-helix-helix protein n=1 Tax=Pseudomonas sp. JUb42 TaxID=2940611 RepID=UPI0021693A83|nr:ribbon-helix-helix protein, CopG family [Pseudomonas sp. JUb42]
MESPVLSFNADGELVEKLDQLALATDQDRQYHLQRALARYVETESWYLRAIQEGIADADAGRLIDLETVKAKWIARANNRTD